MKDKNKLGDNISFKTGKSMYDNNDIHVNVHIQLFDENGNLKSESKTHNAVTDAGKIGIADQMLASPSLPKMGWMAIGTGSPAATLLGAEVARVAFTSKTRSVDIIEVVGTFGAGVGTGTITEAGTFDVVTANTVNMWMVASGFTHTKGAGDVLIITWELDFNP